VHVDASTLTWQPVSEGVRSSKVAVLVVGLSSTDKILTHTLRGMSALAKAGANVQPGKSADFMIATPLPKNVVRLRFVVRESETGRMGTADLAVRR
jgi:hypothetical protein